MIQNERQYKVTKRQIAKLEGALAASQKLSEKLEPRIYEAMMAGIQGEIEKLEHQLQEFELLRSAVVLQLASAADLPKILIQARVARGYTQKELADKLHVKPQQIQKYEQTAYRSASLKRIIEVMKLLEIDFGANIRLEDDDMSPDNDCLEGVAKIAAYQAIRIQPNIANFVMDQSLLAPATGIDFEYISHQLAKCNEAVMARRNA